MGKVIKATLLNALVFPGTGQLSLGAKRGWLYIVIMIIALIAFIRLIIAQATALTKDIDLTQGMPDVTLLAEQATENLANEGGTVAAVSMLVMVTTWVISIVDGVITGRRIQGREKS